MVTQRRYSVTGQTPPDDAEAMKARSPKLQALDTSVPSTSCGLCEGSGGAGAGCGGSGGETSRLGSNSDDGGADQMRGRKMVHTGTIVRTSSKRSATQLPSPSHELPPKIARYRRGTGDDIDVDADTDTDTDIDVDIDTDIDIDVDADIYSRSSFHLTSTNTDGLRQCSGPPSVCSLPDAECLQKLQLGAGIDWNDHHHQPPHGECCDDEDDDDDCMEDLALSPPHSRNHSLDCTPLDKKYALQQEWLHAYAVQRSQIMHIEDIAVALPTQTDHVAPTFLTLPPEIRHQIYRNCEELVFKQPLLYCIATAFDKIQHPLAAVSRQVRSEALAIFYSYNTWTIKVEFRMMYEGFQHWIIRLGEGAGSLRLIDFSVRGTLFKPKRTHTQSVLVHGQLIQITPGLAANGREELYSPPDGDASFKIDLSEKYMGGKVQVVRNDGTKEAGEKAKVYLEKLVHGLWEKRRTGTLNGQDWVTMVDQFITFIGGW